MLRAAPHPGRGAELSALASVLGIDGLLSAMPARLSGGQAHRVALGRLLLARCDTLLLDEPYTGLDASLRRTLTDLVSSLVAERSVPAVLVTHELADAQAFADRLAVLDRGEMLQIGEPDEVVLQPGIAARGGVDRLPRLRPEGGTGGRNSPRACHRRGYPRSGTRADGCGRGLPARGSGVGSRSAGG